MRDYEYNDALYRSRNTILDILEEQGFVVSKYRGFSPKELQAMMSTDVNVAQIDVNHKNDEERKARVIYYQSHVNSKNSPKIVKLLQAGFVEDEEKLSEEDAANLTCYVMINDTVGDVHNAEALGIWNEHGLKVYFCCIYNFVNNPLKHILVPKHEIIPSDQHDELLKKLLINSKSQLPIIRYHVDPITKCLAIVPGDIVKITRPSPSSGEYVVYRICAG
jgi:DNA-directed RNA polymerase subunit H